MSWAERSTGISTTSPNSLRPMFGRVDSIDADITRHRRADRGASGPFHVEGDPGHQVLIAEDLGAAPTPLALAQAEVLHQKERSQPHPSRWRGAATSI